MIELSITFTIFFLIWVVSTFICTAAIWLDNFDRIENGIWVASFIPVVNTITALVVACKCIVKFCRLLPDFFRNLVKLK